LFNAALKAGVPVLPLTLNYNVVDGMPASRANRDLVCWYGDMNFAPHFQALLGFKDVQVTLCVGQAIAPVGDANALALAAETVVRNSFIPFSGPLPVPLNAMEA
jgi:1-acyl-sn-glycerol-3-phosphate acyltransferase